LDSISIYEDASRLLANSDENGYWSYALYNQGIRVASNRVIDYITGDFANQTLPISYSTQKAKDFISSLITPYSSVIANGIITKPDDYYHYDNLYILSLKNQEGCSDDGTSCDEDDVQEEIIKTPVEMLDGQQFYVRAQTYIKGLKPSPKKPICKMIGNTIEFLPRELGSCTLEYIRYPIYGEIKTIEDPIYYNIVADPATSIDNEFGEWARELLLYYLVQGFSTHISQQSLYQMNEASGKK
jgi:hypothetical protein